METSYDIQGMTCAHCARSVSEELSAIDGVTSVAVDVAAGTATVASASILDENAVRAAIEEAGYVLARPGLLPLL
ncbi:heavy-metal-associated domain-containing protein [Leifsonia poae]|uniref:Heavy metal transport/detoxification protein n=1 Tax=Leifsonia poae TaxID=110933 RepID=A0A9W6HCB6_9MICO|nr:heavy-metal-associated domain-containing protein [Leifsonia poae]GLJ77463.1 heavy metal transport/detoxification protein [Leifsonia poae]